MLKWVKCSFNEERKEKRCRNESKRGQKMATNTQKREERTKIMTRPQAITQTRVTKAAHKAMSADNGMGHYFLT